jgi:hypothetical protein
MKKGIIVALDVDGAEARRLVTLLESAVDFYKVPPALTLEDPGLTAWLLKRKKKVFLDCKWFDIPTQVARSVEAAGRAGVTAVTLHAGVGTEILKAAVAVRAPSADMGRDGADLFGSGRFERSGISSNPVGASASVGAVGPTRRVWTGWFVLHGKRRC